MSQPSQPSQPNRGADVPIGEGETVDSAKQAFAGDAINADKSNAFDAVDCGASDAEAALLALADGLDFSGPPGSHSQARFGALLYKVQITHHTGTGSKWSAWYISAVGVASVGGFCETRFDSLEEGQAACNRHAATGKWDA